MKTDDEILNEIHIIKNHKNNTIKNYRKAVKQYCGFHQKTLKELLKEAEKEEDQNIKWKHRKLKNRLIQYRQYLIENYSKKSINTYFNPIIMIYNYYEIELQPLPKIDTRRLKQSPPISYKDLPDKDVIRAALNIASPVMKPLILFMVSSGCAKAETLNLTIQDYINATREYHNTNNIYQVIDTLNQIDDVIPTWEILRVKTNKYYTTYSSPESVHAINNYLVSRKDPLTPDKKLFKIGNTTFTLNFEEINDELGLGYIGKYRRFRSHMIRKFHASALYNDGMALDKVNDLQGKTKNRTDSVYFMTNPEDLKYEYVEHLPVLTMSKDVEKVTVKSPEFHRLENELREKTDAVESMSNRMDNMERMLQEIANQNVTWEDVKKEY